MNFLSSITNSFLSKVDQLFEQPNKQKAFLSGALSYAAILPIAHTALQLASKLNFISQSLLNQDNSSWECPEEMHMTLVRKVFETCAVGTFIVILAPFCEELLLREGFQRELLDKKLSEWISRYSPALADQWQGIKGKCTRILLIGLLFAAAHQPNHQQPPGMSESEFQERVMKQVVGNIGLGLVSSSLQESYGFWSALGAHITTNMIGFSHRAYYVLTRC